MISDCDLPEGFEEIHTKVIESIYNILNDTNVITKWYKPVKARNAIVCERNNISISLEDIIIVVSELEILRRKYPVNITISEFNYVIMVDKVKYRKFIINKLIK